MDIHFHSINLPCFDVRPMAAFLSSVFDTEIQEKDGMKFFTMNGLRINLLEGSSSAESLFPMLELSAINLDALRDFKQKYDLFVYKTKGFQDKSHFDGSSFEFKDPCGNLWRVQSDVKKSKTIDHASPTLM